MCYFGKKFKQCLARFIAIRYDWSQLALEEYHYGWYSSAGMADMKGIMPQHEFPPLLKSTQLYSLTNCSPSFQNQQQNVPLFSLIEEIIYLMAHSYGTGSFY